MRATLPRPSTSFVIVALILLAAPLARKAEAQALPAPVVEFAAGALEFADDGVVTEGFAGGAARFYISPRISVGPEVAFINGERHSHQMVTGNLTVDVLGPVNGRSRRITPFAVVGGGLFRTSEQFPTGTYSSGEGAFTAGGGVRARAGNRLTFGAEARVGWELHVRFNAMVGVQLGR